MKAYVISLEGSERRAVARERAIECGLDLIFFDGINLVDKNPNDYLDLFDIDGFKLRHHRSPSSGDIGCTLSHYSLWKKLSNETKDKYHLILEDDFISKVHAEEILEVVNSTDLNFDVLLLGYSKVTAKEESIINIINPIKELYSTEQHRIGFKFRESSCGAVAYIVSRNFITKVSKLKQKPCHVPDDWPFFKQNGFNILHVKPLCFYEDFLNMKSYIKESGRYIPMHDNPSLNKKNLLFRVLRWVYRYSYGRLLASLMYFGIRSSS
jgi:glycosyl transferase, family 25